MKCTICLIPTSVPHYHHTVPQSRGGVNSQQIPLCASCHNVLHAQALNIVSKKRTPKVFWEIVENERRALPYLKILVSALSCPIVNGYTRKHKLVLEVPTNTFESFKQLQLDLGLSSQEKTLMYCLVQQLKIRGICDEINSAGSKRNKKLWFV